MYNFWNVVSYMVVVYTAHMITYFAKKVTTTLSSCNENIDSVKIANEVNLSVQTVCSLLAMKFAYSC